ncbi:MAG: hypothetical protein RLZZ293_1203, partial [Pseudomonadota bacterium]
SFANIPTGLFMTVNASNITWNAEGTSNCTNNGQNFLQQVFESQYGSPVIMSVKISSNYSDPSYAIITGPNYKQEKIPLDIVFSQRVENSYFLPRRGDQYPSQLFRIPGSFEIGLDYNSGIMVTMSYPGTPVGDCVALFRLQKIG